ncbi:hypothetical protein MHU86_22255 [Fragilaria crotonensis]|nr:hypothetical protein MHU86_22255 [Fragilaria crotonensis]
MSDDLQAEVISRQGLGLALTIIPTVTGTISLLSSIVLIWYIVREKRLSRAREQILIGLSILDIAFSSACAMSTFTAPEDIDPLTEYVLRGNIATCNLQDGCISSELPLRCTTLSLAFIVSYVLGIILELYNYGGMLGCWIDDAQLDLCDEGYVLTSCSRGHVSDLYVFVFAILPGVLSLMITILATSMLYCRIRAIEQQAHGDDRDTSGYSQATRAARFQVGDIPRDDEQDTTTSLESSHFCCRLWRRRSRRRSTQFRMSKKVLESGTLYVVAFWITYTPFIVISILSAAGSRAPDWLRVANVFLLPLQGSFNLLIYKIPDLQGRLSRASPTSTSRMEMRSTATNVPAQECSPESSNVSEHMNAPTRTGRSDFAVHDPGVQVSND